jgi:hypothetical protein
MDIKSALKSVIDLCKAFERLEKENYELRKRVAETEKQASDKVLSLESNLRSVDLAIFPNGLPRDLDSARTARIAALVKSAIFLTKLKKAGVEEVRQHIIKKEPVKRAFRNETLEMLIRRDANEQRKFQRLVVQKPHEMAMDVLRKHATFSRVSFNDSQVKRLRKEFGCD